MEDKFENIDIVECTKALESYGDLAGYEAITRALLNERNGNRERAIFWVEVFINISKSKYSNPDLIFKS